jgi:hypothetical protein
LQPAGSPIVTIEPDHNHDEAAFLDEARACLRHEWRFFGLSGVTEDRIDWSRDPLTGITAPQDFSLSINHRDRAVAGDVKFTWEKNRLHQATVMAAAFTLTGESDFAAETVGQLQSWIAANPLLKGINWTHPLEAAIRTIALVWSERLLRGSPHHLFFESAPFLTSLDDHLWFIDASYSTGSSANNHLIGEAAGAYIGASALVPSRAGMRIRARAKKMLEKEIVRQTFPDGINRELGFEYHLFTADFFLLSLYEARRSGDDFSPRYGAILRSMIEAIARLRDKAGHLPAYGDGDDGRALLFDARNADRTAWLLQLGATLTGATICPSSAAPLTLRFLQATPAALAAGQSATPISGHDAFTDAGLYLMRSSLKEDHDVQLLIDAGQLGFGSLAAHGHADALSFTLSAGGVPLFVDPGTYTYFGDEAGRSFFRGTAAHNTVRVDNCDQATQAGAFLWSSKFRTTVEQWENREGAQVLTAAHDGYRRKGVLHRRSFTFAGTTLTITDVLEGKGTHFIELFFHGAPDCRVKTTGTDVLVESNHCGVHMRIPSPLAVTVEHGGKAGWYSPCFGVRIPSPVIIAFANTTLPVSFTTTIEMHYEG